MAERQLILILFVYIEKKRTEGGTSLMYLSQFTYTTYVSFYTTYMFIYLYLYINIYTSYY